MIFTDNRECQYELALSSNRDIKNRKLEAAYRVGDSVPLEDGIYILMEVHGNDTCVPVLIVKDGKFHTVTWFGYDYGNDFVNGIESKQREFLSQEYGVPAGENEWDDTGEKTR